MLVDDRHQKKKKNSMATTTTPASSSRRPELAADAAWDAALDLGLRRTVYGTLGGLVAAAVLFRECG